MIRAVIGIVVGLPVVVTVGSLILNVILASLLALTYSSLTKEQLVATITFENVPSKSKVYTAHLYDDKGSKIDDYIIYGDQWRMDAGFIKMKYWANVFGVDSKYTLDRFEGRYSNIDEENNSRHKSYQLEDHSLIDNMSWLIDTTYGSSTYQDIKLNTKYTVLRSQTGLMVREELIKVEKEKSLVDKTKSFFGF